MPGVKAALFRILLVAGSLLGVFLAAEIAFRAAAAVGAARQGGLESQLERARGARLSESPGAVTLAALVQPSAHEDVVYELKPNQAGLFEGKRVEINSAGCRGRESAREKPAGVFRIAGLGDSVMFGWGVGQEDAYLAVLEERLNGLPGEHPEFEVLNFAVPGYNTAIEAAVFEHKALAFDPDLVILQFVNNDFDVPTYMLKPRNTRSLRRSFVLDFLRTRLVRARRELNESLVEFRLDDMGEAKRGEVLDRYAYMTGPEGCRRAMERLARLAGERGIPVIVLHGTVSGEQKRLLDELAAAHSFRLVDIRPFTDRYVREHGIENTKDARRKALWVSEKDPHPNAVGHAIYADGLEENLQAMGVIGRAR